MNDKAEIAEMVKTKTAQSSRTILGIILGLIVLGIFSKIIAVIVGIITALGFGAIGIHVSESKEASTNIQNFSIIMGFFGAVYLANKVYKRITRKNIDPNVPIKKKKWYQFSGFA